MRRRLSRPERDKNQPHGDPVDRRQHTVHDHGGAEY
jgi:hypothetical protein